MKVGVVYELSFAPDLDDAGSNLYVFCKLPETATCVPELIVPL